MLQGKGCQEKKHSALIHEVPRNICVVLISNSVCKGVCGLFFFSTPLPQGAREEMSLSVQFRKRYCNEEVSCHKY